MPVETDSWDESCVDCAFDTHQDPAANWMTRVPARDYFAARRARVNARRATPFLSDIQKREIFETVSTLDVL